MREVNQTPTKDEEKRFEGWTSNSSRGRIAVQRCFPNQRSWRKKCEAQSQSKVLLSNREAEPVLFVTPHRKTALSGRAPAQLCSAALALRWSLITHTLSPQYFTLRQETKVFRPSSMLPWNLWTVVSQAIYGITVTPWPLQVTPEMMYPDACTASCMDSRGGFYSIAMNSRIKMN